VLAVVLLSVVSIRSFGADDAFTSEVAREIARTATLDLRVLAAPTADDYRVAFLMLKVAQDLDPENIELTRRLIEAAWAVGDQDAVIDQTRRLIKLDPDDTVSQLRLISWRINQRQTAEARLEAYDRFLGEAGAKIDPSIRSRLALDSAMLSRELGDLDAFAQRLSLALRLDVTNKEAASLALTFFADRVDDPLGRLELMSQLLLADPLDPQVHHRIAIELASHGAFQGSARFHQNLRTLAMASTTQLQEAMQVEMMCLNWSLNGPQVILDQLQIWIATRKFSAQQVLDASIEDDTPLPDGFVAPDDVRLSSSFLTMRLYAADAAGDGVVRSEALEDVTISVREQIAQISELDADSGYDPQNLARAVFAMKYDIFRAYAMFGDDVELVELAADDLRRFAGKNSMIAEDIDAWMAIRTDDVESALAYFKNAPTDEIVSQIGLAMASEQVGRMTDAISAYHRIQRMNPLGVQAAWARTRVGVLAISGAPALSPWTGRMEQFAARSPRWLDEMVSDTTSFMTLRAELAQTTNAAIDPSKIIISVRNVSPVPLGVGPDRPINSSFMLSPRTEVQVQEQMSLVQPEIIELGRRLRLLPRETLTVEIDPKTGFTGWVIETNSFRTIRTRWRAVQGYLYGERGYFEPGPMCLSTSTGQQLESLNPDTLLPIDELTDRIRTSPTSQIRQVLIAVRTRLMVPESNEPDLTRAQRVALASACADRFAEGDALTRLLMLAVLPHEGQAAEMRELDELARKDLEPRVLALTVLTRMPTVDAALLDRARALGEPWLSELSGVIEARTAAGVLGYAHATPAVRSLGGYLRGSGTLDSPEFDRPEVEEDSAAVDDAP